MCGLVACAGARGDTVVAPLSAETPVRAWAGIALLSVRDPGGYRLATQQGNEAPRELTGIAPSQRPFDANIGPGPNGSPVIVFARCTRGAGCRLMRTTQSGARETPVGGSSSANSSVAAPAVWGTRVAFARRSRDGSVHVYVGPLESSSRARLVRLPDVPRPECLFPEGCFARRVRPRIAELALRGATLAEQIDLGLVENLELCDRTEVRLIDIALGRSRRVAHTHCGLAGSTLIGVSLTATHLLYARVCPGDPAGCSQHNTDLYRYDLRRHRLEAGSQRDLLVSVDATSDDSFVEVVEQGAGDCTDHPTQPAAPCALVRTGPARFRPLHRRAP